MNAHRQASDAVVEVDRLVTHYGERRILDGIDLRIRQGEIMAIMGGSGAGKSTLLRHILGLSSPTRGAIRLLGHEMVGLRKKDLYALRRRIGVAFQGGALLTSMTVGENVALPLREHTRLDRSTIRIMTRLKLEMVNLSAAEHRMPAELSGGMLKRAALARAIIMDPAVLFFDEPSSGLDPISAVELDEMILRLKQAMNMTIVVVTHELQSALTIADRITILSGGRIITTGTVDDVRNSSDEYIRLLLDRRSRINTESGEAYLRRLTDEP